MSAASLPDALALSDPMPVTESGLGVAGCFRFAGKDPLDDPQLAAFQLLEKKALGTQMSHRLSGQVIGLEANRDRVECSLDDPDGWLRARHVFKGDEATTWTQDPLDLSDDHTVVGH